MTARTHTAHVVRTGRTLPPPIVDDDWEPDPDQDYCGCCGREAPTGADWCDGCAMPGHLAPITYPALGCPTMPWDRTWSAQHQEPCPYQVGSQA